MTGDSASQVPGPQGLGGKLVAASMLGGAVAARVGGLVGDEQAFVFGATEAASVGSDPDEVLIPSERVEELSAVILAGRTRPCGFCHRPLPSHTVTVGVAETEVWCEGATDATPATTWLAGPVRPSAGSVFAGLAFWIGIPAISAGLLAWLPALIAGLIRGRRRWLAAAAVFAALNVVEFAVFAGEPEQPTDQVTASSWLAVGVWLAAMIYGGFQVKPWLTGRSTRQHGSR